MYEVREQVINSAESHKIQVINSLENMTLVFFLYFFIFECILCLFCFFIHEFVWEVEHETTGLVNVASVQHFTEERLTSQRSGAKVIIEQIKVKFGEISLHRTFLKRMISAISRISLGNINLIQFIIYWASQSLTGSSGPTNEGRGAS